MSLQNEFSHHDIVTDYGLLFWKLVHKRSFLSRNLMLIRSRLTERQNSWSSLSHNFVCLAWLRVLHNCAAFLQLPHGSPRDRPSPSHKNIGSQRSGNSFTSSNQGQVALCSIPPANLTLFLHCHIDARLEHSIDRRHIGDPQLGDAH